MLVDILINVLASALLVVAGYVGGKFRERRRQQGRTLEDYDFYPFGLDERRSLNFDVAKFNPAKALCLIKNNVTGRSIEAPATNLVLDLKMRRQRNEDKLNYELNIGARKFKCTTIPIYREKYGLVGAICINVDVNYLNDEVRKSAESLDAFFSAICRTSMSLDENILSREEYEKANAGKRHYRDFTPLAA